MAQLILAENYASAYIFAALGAQRRSNYGAGALYSLELTDALEKLGQFSFPREILAELQVTR